MKKTLLMLTALLCCCFALKAQDFTHNGLKYRVTGTNPPTVTLTGHTEGFAAHDFVIPSTVTYEGTDYSVTSIGNKAFFFYTGLTGSLTIPNSVTSIGNYAFTSCYGLENHGTLHIGNSVTDIGVFAFEACYFTGSLDIPNSVKRIGDHAFELCIFNGTLTLGNSLEYIGDLAFSNCEFTGSLDIPESVTNIGHGAFNSPYSNFNGTLTINSSQMTIKEKAFSNTKSKKIIVKTGVSPNMEEGSLAGMSSLTSIIVPCGRAEYYGNHLEWGDYWELISQDMLFSLTVSADDPNHGTVRKTQPDDCSYITATATATPNEGFTFAGWMENDTLVTTENPYIFDLTRNRNLTAVFEGPWHDITVSANPAEAGTVSAIYKGEPATSAPEGGFITAVATPTDDYIFSNWTESGSPISYANPYTFVVTCDRNLTANFVRQNYDFYATCTTGQTLYYKITDAEQHLVRIVAPNSNDQNGWGENKPTGSITLPETVRHNGTDYTVTEIGDYAFYRCEGLNGSLAIPNTVTEIGDWAFYNCIGFSGTLTIGNSVTSIGNNAFQFCKHFTGPLTIPNSVTSIGNYAFQQCEELSGTLTLGSSLGSIGDYAFEKTSFNQIVAKRDTPPTLGADVFHLASYIESVIVPCGLDVAYKTSWVEFADKIEDDFVYGLTVTSSNPDFGSANITQQPDCNTQATVSATPADGHKFVNWTDDGEVVSTENTYTFALESDHNLVANFAVWPTYNIAVSANPTDAGEVTATMGGEPVESALEGSEITVSATPADGYKFVNWTENNEEVSTENTYTFTLESDRDMVANFAAKQLCHISVSVGSEGTGTVTATCGGEPVESALEGSEITVSATPAEGYMFLNWTENGRPVSTSSTYTFTLESDRNLVANFTQYTYVPITSLPGPTTDPLYVIGYQDGDDFYLIDWGSDYQSPMHLSKNPDNPLYFHFAFESGETFKDFTCAKVGHYYYLKIEEGHAFVSSFFAGDDEQPYMIELSPDGDIYSRGSHNNALYHDGDIVKTHYYTLPDNLRFFRLTRYYPVIVSASPAEGGTVSATSEGHEVTQALEGATVTVTATPAEGYGFKNWTEYGRIVSTDNPYSFGIGNYCNLVANFVEPQYDFSATCETGQTLYYRITDAEQHWVSIVAPLGDDPSGWGSSKPEGDIVLPQTVIHDGVEYVVTEIGDYAFYNCRELRGLLDIPVTVTRIGDFAFYFYDDDGWIITTLSISDQVTSIGTSAFKYLFMESIYIGNSVESIGSEALCVFDNTNRHVVSKAQTPPDFEGGFICMYNQHQRIYIHIPKNTLSSYQNAWGDKYNYIEMNDCAFWPGIYDIWQYWENWAPNQQLPAPYDNVTIYGNCLLDVDATVSELRVAAGKTLTIGAGKTLTAVSIILENGAQLINNGTVNCNDITVEKDIEDYGEDTGNWYLVSSPVTASARTSGMATAQAENYDLYCFSQTGDSQGREWLNYKAGAFLMENQSGYLYANKNGTTIVFHGNFATTATKQLQYVEGEGIDFPGFNLVGNPYPCNATISGTGLRSSNYFYKMNANGTNLEVVANPVLAPCTGVFAVAANSDATVTFTPTTANANVTRGEKGSLQDIRVELLADGKVIDRAYLNMNSESLPKFSLQDNGSEICFYQNKEELAVVSTSSTSGEMPLNFKAAKNGSYTIAVNVENADLNYLHLVDNLTGDDVDLMGSEGDVARNVSTYTFDAKTNDYASRFKLVFGVNGDAASAGSADDFAFISNGEIIISNEGRATLQVIDVLGRIVSSEEINGDCRISTNGLTTGLYILNLNGMTQKIVMR